MRMAYHVGEGFLAISFLGEARCAGGGLRPFLFFDSGMRSKYYAEPFGSPIDLLVWGFGRRLPHGDGNGRPWRHLGSWGRNLVDNGPIELLVHGYRGCSRAEDQP